MNDKALKVLEFDKIRQRLEGFMECGLGKERAMELKPYSQIEKVKELLQETDEAKRLLSINCFSPPCGYCTLSGMISIPL